MWRSPSLRTGGVPHPSRSERLLASTLGSSWRCRRLAAGEVRQFGLSPRSPIRGARLSRSVSVGHCASHNLWGLEVGMRRRWQTLRVARVHRGRCELVLRKRAQPCVRGDSWRHLRPIWDDGLRTRLGLGSFLGLVADRHIRGIRVVLRLFSHGLKFRALCGHSLGVFGGSQSQASCLGASFLWVLLKQARASVLEGICRHDKAPSALSDTPEETSDVISGCLSGALGLSIVLADRSRCVALWVLLPPPTPQSPPHSSRGRPLCLVLAAQGVAGRNAG